MIFSIATVFAYCGFIEQRRYGPSIHERRFDQHQPPATFERPQWHMIAVTLTYFLSNVCKVEYHLEAHRVDAMIQVYGKSSVVDPEVHSLAKMHCRHKNEEKIPSGRKPLKYQMDSCSQKVRVTPQFFQLDMKRAAGIVMPIQQCRDPRTTKTVVSCPGCQERGYCKTVPDFTLKIK